MGYANYDSGLFRITKSGILFINSNKKENTNKEKSVLSENLFEENIEKIYKDFFKIKKYLLFFLKIDDFYFSNRLTNCFKKKQIISFKDLVEITEDELLREPNFGIKCLNEFKEFLKKFGYSRLPLWQDNLFPLSPHYYLNNKFIFSSWLDFLSKLEQKDIINKTIIDNFYLELEFLNKDKTLYPDNSLETEFKFFFDTHYSSNKNNYIDIIKARYGFDGNDPLTLEKIGSKYNITRERVRQIVGKGTQLIKKSKILQIKFKQNIKYYL